MKGLKMLAAAALAMGAVLWTGCSAKPQSNEETPDRTATAPESRAPARNKMQFSTRPRQAPTAAAAPASPETPAPPETPAAGAAAMHPAASPAMVQMREQFGMEVTGIAANGPLIDVQFFVSDPEKAGSILSPAAERYLIDRKTGTRIPPPSGARARLMRPVPGGGAYRRTYIASFDNSGGAVKPGDAVSLIMNDYRVDGLIVR